MALSSVGYKMNATLVDAGGNQGTLRYNLTAGTIADALTEAATIITDLNAITDCVVLEYMVGEKFEEDTTFYAAGGVELENVALVVARIDDAEVKWVNIRIPGPNVGIFKATSGPDYNVVDPADTALVTYLNHFATGNEATLSDGETLLSPGTAGNVHGKRIHRGSRKG
jgi:hypothetical protein